MEENRVKSLTLLLAVLVFSCLPVHANPMIINGFDLNSFNFDVAQYNPVGTDGLGGSTASGTSNGVGWSISPTPLWSPRTTTNSTFNFSFLPNPTDSLHASLDFTITFSQTIQTLIVALSNDNLEDSVNFQLMPSFYTSGLSFNGTQAILNTASGGLAFFTNVNSLTISHVNNNNVTTPNGFPDGFDLAFHVERVPEPGTVVTLTAGACLLGLAVRRWGARSAN
jgi:hypothetical protein